MYDKLKNIEVVNEHEPRIKFSVETFKDENGAKVKTTKHFDVCLSMIPFDSEFLSECENLEEALSGLLKIAYEASV